MTPPVHAPHEGLNAAVAAEIRAELGRQKLSVRELAQRSGIKYGTLRRYVTAERHIDVAVLLEIATALEVDVADLVRDARSKADLFLQDHDGNVTAIEVKTYRGPNDGERDLSSFEGADIAARDEEDDD